jgi:hypothetical protein
VLHHALGGETKHDGILAIAKNGFDVPLASGDDVDDRGSGDFTNLVFEVGIGYHLEKHLEVKGQRNQGSRKCFE